MSLTPILIALCSTVLAQRPDECGVTRSAAPHGGELEDNVALMQLASHLKVRSSPHTHDPDVKGDGKGGITDEFTDWVSPAAYLYNITGEKDVPVRGKFTYTLTTTTTTYNATQENHTLFNKSNNDTAFHDLMQALYTTTTSTTTLQEFGAAQPWRPGFYSPSSGYGPDVYGPDGYGPAGNPAAAPPSFPSPPVAVAAPGQAPSAFPTGPPTMRPYAYAPGFAPPYGQVAAYPLPGDIVPAPIQGEPDEPPPGTVIVSPGKAVPTSYMLPPGGVPEGAPGMPQPPVDTGMQPGIYPQPGAVPGLYPQPGAVVPNANMPGAPFVR